MINSSDMASLEQAHDPAVKLDDAVTRYVSSYEDAGQRQNQFDSESSFSASFLVRNGIGEFNDDETLMAELLKIKERCRDTVDKIDNEHTNFAIRMIERISDEVTSMKFVIATNCPRAGWYAYDDKLSRNMDSIVFKLSELSDHYFSNAYYLHHLTTSDRCCNTKDRVNEIEYRWLSDRRIIVGVVSAMLEEIVRGDQ